MTLAVDLILRGVGRLVTCDRDRGEGPLGVIEAGALAASGGRVAWLGPERELAREVHLASGGLEIDAEGKAVLPGLVEPHSHLVFAGDRSEEFRARMAGEPYRTGGIAATVRATRAAADFELREQARARLDRFLAHGVTTLEAKSGYGLTPVEEERLIGIAAGLDHPVSLALTVLAAHVLPQESAADPDRYLESVCEELLPAVQDQVEFCDVWCDEGAFSASQCRRVLAQGARLGLAAKVHAEQLSRSGGARLAAEVGAVSADHLERADQEDAELLSAAGTVAVLIPGASMMTRSGFAPARMLIERGVRVALSTDLNPGSSNSENLQLVVALGCGLLGLTAEEALLGVTRHAAAAIGREAVAGSLRPGVLCDLVVLDTPHEVDLAYHYGVNLASLVLKAGRPVAPASHPLVTRG